MLPDAPACRIRGSTPPHWGKAKRTVSRGLAGASVLRQLQVRDSKYLLADIPRHRSGAGRGDRIEPVLAGAQSTTPYSEHHARNGRERSARAVLEGRYGRTLSDAEWESVKRDLLTFIRLLMDWDREAVDGYSLETPDGGSARS